MALVDARPALGESASIGAFFELSMLGAPAGWRPLRELAEGTALRERVDAATELLGRRTGVAAAVLEPRVVASTVFLGLAARLLAPPWGALVLAGVLPRLRIEELWWQPVVGGPWPLASRYVEGEDVTDAEGPRAYVGTVVDGVVAPLLARAGADFRLSEKVLWGNVASALGGTTSMLVAARPDLADRATSLLTALLRTGPLTGTAELAGSGRPGLVRRSCCLFYRVPGGGLCGDCVLTHAPARAARPG